MRTSHTFPLKKMVLKNITRVSVYKVDDKPARKSNSSKSYDTIISTIKLCPHREDLHIIEDNFRDTQARSLGWYDWTLSNVWNQSIEPNANLIRKLVRAECLTEAEPNPNRNSVAGDEPNWNWTDKEISGHRLGANQFTWRGDTTLRITPLLLNQSPWNFPEGASCSTAPFDVITFELFWKMFELFRFNIKSWRSLCRR